MRVDNILGTSFWFQKWFAPQVPLTDRRYLTSTSLNWEKIEPSNDLQWHPCLDDFKCARLKVPMDWHGMSSEANKTVEIAVIKLEATVPITDDTYGGAVVLNPGGPGGSGVYQVILGGHGFRTLLSAEPHTSRLNAKRFDIIGFDPRGVNNTTPPLACFPDHHAAAAYAIEDQTYGMVDTSTTSFDNLWTMKRAFAQGCSERTAKEGIAKHVSTAAVARDIVEIFEKHGQWREKEVERLLALSSHERLTEEERRSIRARTAYRAEREMIQYWGFSYGTVLGGVLSAMFPDRIKRAVLDGVVDMPDYMAAGWSTNLRDTDRQFPLLAEYCYRGGPQNCAVYDSHGPTAIIENIQKALSHLQHNPIAVPGDDKRGPTVVTYSDFQALVWGPVVYHPLLGFPRTAQVLSEIINRNGTTLGKLKADWHHDIIIDEALSAHCRDDGPYSFACVKPILQAGLDEGAGAGIACSDGLPRTQETKEQYRDYADRLIAASSLTGGRWAKIMMPCTAWTARPHWRYEGDFTSKTKHPILFVGNTVDPVTPLYNAFKMARSFENAGVLHQNSEGHCTIASISMCTGRALREYFQSGRLPGKPGELEEWEGTGAYCEPDILPFSGYHKHSVLPPLPDGEHDKEMWDALLYLNRAF